MLANNIIMDTVLNVSNKRTKGSSIVFSVMESHESQFMNLSFGYYFRLESGHLIFICDVNDVSKIMNYIKNNSDICHVQNISTQESLIEY